ncbi:MAG: hypothetical protein P8018_12615 [Acidobacteriota bacterium]
MAETGPVMPEYKNRKTGLILCGILEIILGLFCILILFFWLIGFLLQSRLAAQGASAMNGRLAVIEFFMYVLIAVFFVWMGIGSIMGRRWARSLMYVVSVYWLVIGVLTTAWIVVFLPHVISAVQKTSSTMSPQEARGVVAFALFFSFIICLLFLILLPAILFLFYRSRHVKATCERLDPKERWTDRVPAPVLGLSVVLFSMSFFAIMGAANPLLPAFGKLVRGPLALAVLFVIAVLYIVASVYTFRRRKWAWTLSLVLTIIWSLSGIVSLFTMNAGKWAAMTNAGSPEASRLITAMNFPRLMLPLAITGFFIWLAFLLYMYRYFKTPPGDETEAQAPGDPS